MPSCTNFTSCFPEGPAGRCAISTGTAQGTLMTESANPYRISRLWAEFVDPAMERAYRLHMQPLLARHLRVALWVWGCLLLAFGLQDLQALGMSDEFLILAGCRALQAALVFALALLLPRYPGLAASGYAVTALEITGLVLFLPIYFLRPDIATITVMVLALMLLAMFLFVPNRLKLTLLSRSEEHTSELQSRPHLVCRLLLEKKKKNH